MERLLSAIRKGNLEKVEEIIAKNSDIINDYEQEEEDPLNVTTPLMEACTYDNTLIVKALIEAGADVNKANYNRITPLIRACWENNSDIVKTLIEAGANVNWATYDDHTPLIIACKKNNSVIVEILIKAGADVNKKGPKDRAPITIATDNKNSKIVDMLNNAGARDPFKILINTVDIDHRKPTPAAAKPVAPTPAANPAVTPAVTPAAAIPGQGFVPVKGWEVLTSKTKGKQYYYCANLQKTSWKTPTEECPSVVKVAQGGYYRRKIRHRRTRKRSSRKHVKQSKRKTRVRK